MDANDTNFKERNLLIHNNKNISHQGTFVYPYLLLMAQSELLVKPKASSEDDKVSDATIRLCLVHYRAILKGNVNC